MQAPQIFQGSGYDSLGAAEEAVLARDENEGPSTPRGLYSVSLLRSSSQQGNGSELGYPLNGYPPPTKWTISSRSPSCKGVCGHCSRGRFRD